MYIKETTGKERLIIAGAVGDAFCNLERAHRMLYRLWEDHFESREQKDIKAYDAKDMGGSDLHHRRHHLQCSVGVRAAYV